MARGTTRSNGRTGARRNGAGSASSRRRRPDSRRTACWILIVSFALTAGLAALAGVSAPETETSAAVDTDRDEAALAADLAAALAPVDRAERAAPAVAPTAGIERSPAVVAAALADEPEACTPQNPEGGWIPREPRDAGNGECCAIPPGMPGFDGDCDGLPSSIESDVYGDWFNLGAPLYPFSSRCEFIGGSNENADIDCDGLTDGWEYYQSGTRLFDHDTDDGGIDDGLEVAHLGTDPFDPADDPADSDGDGLPDVFEVEFLGSDPGDVDTDGDGLTDWEEFRFLGSDPTNEDTDGDGLKDVEEWNVYFTDPTNPDTDGGGQDDGTEIANGADPNYLYDDVRADTGITIAALAVPVSPATTGQVVVDWTDEPVETEVIELVADGVVVATGAPGDGRITDPAAAVGVPIEYELRASWFGGGATQVIGAFDAYVPEPGRECDIAWTGIRSLEWFDERNWAPVVEVGDAVPPSAVPGETDHVCVQLKNGLPVVADTPIGKLGRLTIEDTNVEFLGEGELSIDVVEIDGAFFTQTGEMTVGQLYLDGAVVSASASVGVGDTLSLFGSSYLQASGGVGVESAAAILIGGPGNVIDASLTSLGILEIVGDGPGQVFGDLEVSGDLALSGSSTIRLGVDAATGDVIEVSGQTSLAGTLEVTAVAPPAPDALIPLILTPIEPSTGAFATVTIPTDTTLESTAAGVYLSVEPDGGGGGGDCVDVPEVGFQPVGGCWEAVGDGTYLTNTVIGAGWPVPSIGSLYVQPDSGVDLVLDPEGTLEAFAADRAPGRVSLATVIVTPDDKAGFRTAALTDGPPPGTLVGVLDLGTKLLGSWALDQPLAVNPNSIAGLRADAGNSIQMADGRDTPGWDLDLVASLPGIFGGQKADLSLFAGLDGVDSETVRLADLVGVFGDIATLAGLDLTYVAGEVWEFANGVVDDLEIEGSIDFDVAAGSGTMTVRGLSIADTFTVDDLTLSLAIDGDGIETWSYLADGDQRVREITISHERGDLVGGRIELGDLTDSNGRIPSALVGGDLIDVRGLELEYDGDEEVWALEALMNQPSTLVRGQLEFASGHLVAGTLDLALELGSLARLDVEASFESGGTWALSGFLGGAGFENRSVSGTMTFDEGDLVAGRLELEELPIGELVTIHSVAIWFDRPAGDWNLDGRVTSEGGRDDGFDVVGALDFDAGVMVAAHIELGRFELGPSVVDRLIIDLDRSGPSPGPRTATYLVSGWIAGASDGESVPQEPLTGSMSIVEGRITAMALGVPSLSIGNLAHLTDLTFGYAYDPATDTATMNGSGTLRTADGATGSAATIDVELIDTVLESARITADRLSFGGALTLADLELLYDRTGAPEACDGVPKTIDSAKVWAASGTIEDTRGDPVEVDGCLSMIDRAVVAGHLRVGDVVVDELFRIVEIELTVQNHAFDEQDVTTDAKVPTGATVPVGGTTFGLTAQFATANNSTNVTGSMRIEDGGLAALSVTLGDVPLMTLFTIEDLSLAYDAGPRWDGTADTTFDLSGAVRHGEGTTSLEGSVVFDGDGGSLSSLSIEATGVPFGPADLDRIAFEYDDKDGTGSEWVIGGEITIGSGDSFELDGRLSMESGRVTGLTLDVPRLPVGELILLHDVAFSYARDGAGVETWNGTGSVPQAEGPASAASISLTIGADRRFAEGRVELDEIGWAGLFHVEDLVLEGVRTGNSSTWSVLGQLSVGDGQQTRFDGQVTIDDGRVIEGELHLSDLSIAGLVEIDQLDLRIAPGDDGLWSAFVEFGSGASGGGSMRFEDGAVRRADLQLGGVEIGELLRLDALRIEFDSGRRWAASATITDEDGTSTLSGSLTFDDGDVISGSLSMANVQLGPIDLQSFQLSLATTVVIDGVTRQASSVCDVTEPLLVDGVRWAVQAVVRTDDGDTRSIGGRLRLDGDRITDAVLCGTNVQIADMIVLQDFELGYTSTGGGDLWTGSVTVADPQEPDDPFGASLTFTMVDRQLRMLDLSAEGLNFGNLLRLHELEFSYDRDEDDALWSLSAELGRPGGTPGSIDGSLEIVDGVVAAGSLTIEDLPFGDAFTLTDVEIDYVGRRAESSPWPEDVPSGVIGLTENNDCGTVPAGSNVPSGTPTTTGPESYFRVSAAVEANGDSFGVGGSISFADGRMTSFDVTLDCVPLGDWMMLQDVRVLYAEGEEFLLTGRLEDDDTASSDPRFFARMTFDDGRLVGGSLTVGGIGLGVAQLETFSVTLGQQPDGTSVWAATLQIRNEDDQIVGGSGSITIDEGRIVAGSIEVPTIPIADLLLIENVALGFDASVPGEFRIFGSGGLTVASGAGGSVGIDMRFREGKLVAGTFTAGAIKLFDIIPVATFFLSFDNDTKSWTAALSVSTSSGGGPPGPGFQAGVEVRNGKLISGIIGFDADGDGEVDAPAPDGDAAGSGNGEFAGLPLRAFYLRYCAEASSAPFCGPGLEDTWDGRITIEFPTESAPSLDAQLRIKNGKFAAAFLEIGLPAPGIPIFTGVFLNSLQASLELDPRLRFCGGLGITVGPSTLTVARLEAAIEFSEEPLPYDPPPPELCELTPPGEVPDDWEPEYLRFLIQGTAELFPGNPLNIDISGQTYLELQTRGYLGAGASFNVEFINNLLGVEGYAEGSLFNANNVPATNPRTGQPLTGAVVQLKGGVAAQILGKDIAEADFVVNTVGAAGCAKLNLVVFSPRVGAGFYWAGGDKLTCDLGQFEIIVPNTVSLGSTGGATGWRLAAAEDVVAEFEVLPGERLLGVDVLGDGGAPDVSLLGPDGTVLRFDESDIETTGHLVSTTPTKRYFVVAMPAAGTWRVETNDGSLPVLETTTYFELPTPEVTGTVAPGPDGYELDVEILDIPGQEVVFVEREQGSEGVLTGIGTWLTPGSSIGTTFTTFDFLPGGAASGGTREIVALVWQDGFQRDEIVVATYEAPAATPASAPTSIVATEVPGGATVTWEPPADHVGREVTGYRITSTTGFAITVGPDVRSATVEIPMMTPGEVVPVIVTARTGVGWGEPGWAEFSSTQTTGASYAVAALEPPDPDDPDGPDPTDPTVPTTSPSSPTTIPGGPIGGNPTTTAPGTTVPAPVTTVPAPTSPTVVLPTSPADAESPLPTIPTGGRLPVTGDDSRRPLSLATVLVVAGVAVVFVTRRRRPPKTQDAASTGR